MKHINANNLVSVHSSQFKEYFLDNAGQHWLITDKKIYIMEGDVRVKGFVKAKLRFATIDIEGVHHVILTPFN